MKINPLDTLFGAVENYYQHNPCTLMPLLMVALATRGELNINTSPNEEDVIFSKISLNEVINYDWVRLNSSFRKKIKELVNTGSKILCVQGYVKEELQDIYKTFHYYDSFTVKEEHLHRMGVLYAHSSNAASEYAYRQYATICLAETLIATPKELLDSEFLKISNLILVKSGLQPNRPRLRVAEVLSSLLKYDGNGLVYNPFAGCGIAAAAINAGSNMYADGNRNDKLFAVARLLNYGMGGSNEHYQQRDSTKWLSEGKIDYLLSTYTGYISGKSAFEFCLEKCLTDDNFTGKYAGIAQPREIFEKELPSFKEALQRDWVETIALLPFGEVAILINANKDKIRKKNIRFIDGSNPLTRRISLKRLIENDKFAKIINVSNAKKKGYLKSLVVKELKERVGFQKVRLRDLIKKLPKKVYILEKYKKDQRVLAYINRKEIFNGNGWDENIERRPISNLFSPAYRLNEDSLIVNQYGLAEPRLFNAESGSAFFVDGFAFSLNGIDNPYWLICELQETYVRRQLHPYGINQMVPNPLTEEDYLNIVLYKPVDNFEYEKTIEEELEEGADALSEGFTLIDGNKQYTILNFIAHGAFGYTYRAEMLNCSTGEKEIVAIKEFYPTGVIPSCTRENNRVIFNEAMTESFNKFKEMFRSEPQFILSMSDVAENHVTEVKSIFEYEPTGTMYYVMKYYAGETLNDMIIAGQVPSSESLIIEKIVIPLCKALKAMHSHYILHLDIKPENIVIDENGEAVLIDFGVAQLYDNEGRLISKRDTHSRSCFSAPENTNGQMRYFGPQSDIFGTAATLFALVSNGLKPHPVNRKDKFPQRDSMNCSEEMKDAILEGMHKFANDRPFNANMFLNNFPGCKNLKL